MPKKDDHPAPASDESPVGRNITELREARGLTQAGLADRAGLTEQTISNAEVGRHRPQTKNLEKIAKALGVPVARLYEPRRDAATQGAAGPVGAGPAVTDIPDALRDFIRSGRGGNVTPDEVASLLTISFRGEPTVDSYDFLLKAIRSAKK